MSLLGVGGQGVHITTGQPAQSSTKLSHKMSLHRGWSRRGVGVHLTKGQPAQSSTKLGHEMSLHRGVGGYVGAGGDAGVWGVGGTSDQRSA